MHCHHSQQALYQTRYTRLGLNCVCVQSQTIFTLKAARKQTFRKKKKIRVDISPLPLFLGANYFSSHLQPTVSVICLRNDLSKMCTHAHKQTNTHSPHKNSRIKHVHRIPPVVVCAKVSRLRLSLLRIPNSSGNSKSQKLKKINKRFYQLNLLILIQYQERVKNNCKSFTECQIVQVFLHYNLDICDCNAQIENKKKRR